VNAERAWNRADSLERPVWISATVAILVTRIESAMTRMTVKMAIMVGLQRKRRAFVGPGIAEYLGTH
jgi:hypothetical protein